MTERAKEGLIDLVEDENGLWTIEKPFPPEVNVKKEFHTKVVKFFAPTRTCPVHGEVKVLDRNFQRSQMLSVEGLECGHTLLITRAVEGLKELKNGGYPAITQIVLGNQKLWKHKCWRLTFKDTVLAG